MKLVKPKFEILEQTSGIDGVLKQIELAGRTCYYSYENMTAGSAKEFSERMIKSGHYGMLEHGTVYLSMSHQYNEYQKYEQNKYSIVNSEITGYCIMYHITTNYNVLVENNWLNDLKYLCKPTILHEKRITVLFHCDRITGESFLRHRKLLEDQALLENIVSVVETNYSYARQSTRFCNFGKDKFNNNVHFVIPTTVTFNYNLDTDYQYQDAVGNTEAEVEWMISCLDAEKHYFKLLELGWKPENVRYALGFSLYSPLVVTANVSDWEHFFKLRTDKAAHPDARELAIPLQEEFKNRKWIH